MRTAIISDLHIGGLSGEALLEHEEIRELLMAELEGAERVVLLGDAVELRDLPIARALAASEPFFRDLAEAVPGAEVILVPGNHDHHLAAPILEDVALAGADSLGLEQLADPRAPAARRISEWLGSATFEIAYPGIWLRDDVYATHGHHMDPHLTLPRAECIAAAAVAKRTGALTDPATPAHYERLLGPVYGLTHGLAQAGVWQHVGAAARPSERAFTWLSRSGGGGRARRLVGGATAGVALPAATGMLNRLLGSQFEPDVSVAAINRGGVAAGIELARRLRLDAAHVITGHTHHAGPRPGTRWTLQSGGDLHNTGNWIFARLLDRGTRGGPFWPGTVTWLGVDGPPERRTLLDGYEPAALSALTKKTRDARA